MEAVDWVAELHKQRVEGLEILQRSLEEITKLTDGCTVEIRVTRHITGQRVIAGHRVYTDNVGDPESTLTVELPPRAPDDDGT